jgi:sterol-4alpha-carboxylate 3-dehydrogenase (decarboxylating)
MVDYNGTFHVLHMVKQFRFCQEASFLPRRTSKLTSHIIFPSNCYTVVEPSYGVAESGMSGSMLILGGCGFLGAAIVEAFLEADWEGSIVVASRNPTSLSKRVEYRAIDVFNEKDVTRLLADVRPQLVLHLVSPQHTAPPQLLWNSNVTGTEKLLSICKRDPHVKALLYTSTTRAIANPAPAILTEAEAILYDESSSIHPYAKTKAIADRKVLEANGHDLRTAVLRPPIIYGERGPHLDIVMDMLDKGQQKVQLGDDKRLFEIVGVENAAYAHVLAAKALQCPRDAPQDIAGHAFFITDDNPMTWYDLARRIWAEAGDKTRAEEIKVVPFWLLLIIAYVWEWTCWFCTLGFVRATAFNSENIKILRDGNCVLNISKAERMLGYKPRLETNEGIRKAARGAQSRRKRA